MSPARQSAAAKKAAARPTAHLDDIVDEAQQLQQSVGEAADAVYAQLADHATQRPYRTLGTAAGIGFVLAGGLTPKVAGLMLSFGSKWLLGRLTDQFMPPSDG
jgi:ElaB/YqjD/DUF883 family membrane-anchored ribosome-binding protein